MLINIGYQGYNLRKIIFIAIKKIAQCVQFRLTEQCTLCFSGQENKAIRNAVALAREVVTLRESIVSYRTLYASWQRLWSISSGLDSVNFTAYNYIF